MTHHADTLQAPAQGFIRLGGRAFEMRLWIVLLLLSNLGMLLGGPSAQQLNFLPEAVTGGQWWRLLTGFFVHISPYHLLIDSAAFMLLWHGLEEPRALVRLRHFLCAAAGSLLLPLMLSQQIYEIGLCGLSGIDCGLMAVTALELRHDRARKAIGNLVLGLLVLKCGWELVSGKALLMSWHLGDVGVPIVATHAGGMLGGLLSGWMVRRMGDKRGMTA